MRASVLFVLFLSLDGAFAATEDAKKLAKSSAVKLNRPKDHKKHSYSHARQLDEMFGFGSEPGAKFTDENNQMFEYIPIGDGTKSKHKLKTVWLGETLLLFAFEDLL